MLITMVQSPASYLIHIPRYVTFWIHRVEIRPNIEMYYARYLGLGKRYEAGSRTIVISVDGAFQ